MPSPAGAPPDDEGIDGWRAVPVRCRFCGHRHWSVHPVGTDESALECPACHLMEAEVIEQCEASR